MGFLTYGDIVRVRLDDRFLAHLQIVISTKMRRGEGFNFSWTKDTSEGGGRSSIWLHPSIPLVYDFEGGRPPSINRDWLEVLMASAERTTGLEVIPESQATTASRADANVLYAAAVSGGDSPDAAATGATQ